MKKKIGRILLGAVVVCQTAALCAGEDGLSNQEIRSAMQSYATEVTHQHGGYFPVVDDRTGKARKLSFQQVHERVGKLSTKDGYFSCADFVDQETGEKLDLDFWVVMRDGELRVTETEIHKVNDKPRFTYTDTDEKVILN